MKLSIIKRIKTIIWYIFPIKPIFSFFNKKKKVNKQSSPVTSFDYQPSKIKKESNHTYKFSQKNRYRVVSLVFGLFLLSIIARSAYLQISQPPRILEQAKKQSKKIYQNLYRGEIYDSNNNVLAGVLPLYKLSLYRKNVKDIAVTANKLKPYFPKLSPQRLIDVFNKTKQKEIVLATNITSSFYSKIQGLASPEFHFKTHYMRVYPWKKHLANTIGFTGSNLIGREGIEYYYNKLLLYNQSLPIHSNPFSSISFGNNIHLTIDSRMQYIATDIIKRAKETMQAKSILATVMEANTGRILVNAYTPSFNPNRYQQYKSNLYPNPLVHMTYEPGSTFKIITLASALETHSIEPEQQFFCENGAYRIYDATIHDTSAHGWLSVSEILQKSSNICTTKIAFAMGKRAFFNKIQSFGFGKLTGIHLPGESIGLVNRKVNSWSKVDLAALSFGHFIAVTPIQLLRAVNTIASGGYLVTPYIIETIKNKDNKSLPLPPHYSKQILSKNTVQWLTKYMISVTKKGGTGYDVSPDSLEVAGKTGTARKFSLKLHQYSKENHVLSFIGFFPAEHPLFTLLVVIDEPKKPYKGHLSGVPVFKEITEHMMNLYSLNFTAIPKSKLIATLPLVSKAEIPTTRTIKKTLYHKTIREALVWAFHEKIHLYFQGSGKIYRIVANKKDNNSYTAYLK